MPDAKSPSVSEGDFREVIDRLARIETLQGVQVDGVAVVSVEQISQGNRLARIETTLVATGPRCASHSRRLGVLEQDLAPLASLPQRVGDLEKSDRRAGIVSAAVGSATTVATALILLFGKWLTGR